MQKLFIEATVSAPEINFSPADRLLMISGTSCPEDVRALYYPVTEWTRIFVDEVSKGEYPLLSKESPLKIKINLDYFNSSSAKFLFDILSELKRLVEENKPVVVEWFYDLDDSDQKEAGEDMASLVGMKFTLIPNPA